MKRRIRLLTLALVSALILAGCAQAPLQPVPTPEPPAAWRHPVGSAALQAAWWAGFGDPTLVALVREALANNQDLRLAAARVAEARALATAQHAVFWPSLDAGLGAGRSRSISDVTLKPYLSTGHQELFQASYEVDLWGRIDAIAQAADLSEDAIRAARDSVALSVAASVAQAYIGLLELDAQLDLARRQTDSRARTLALVRRRLDHGYASQLELAQASAEQHAGAQAIPQILRALERQEAQLNLLLGRRPGPIERGGSLSGLQACPLPDAGLPSELLRRRPDIHSAERQVAASDAQLAAARTQWLPALRLNASLGRVGASVLRGDPFTIWSLGGSVLAPIFNGGRLQALAQASQARRDQALAAYERTVLAAWGEVEVQLNSLEQEQVQWEEAQAQHRAMADSLRITQRRVQEGQASALEERQAERALLGAEQNLANLQAGLLQTQVALYRALGGGWSEASP